MAKTDKSKKAAKLSNKAEPQSKKALNEKASPPKKPATEKASNKASTSKTTSNKAVVSTKSTTAQKKANIKTTVSTIKAPTKTAAKGATAKSDKLKDAKSEVSKTAVKKSQTSKPEKKELLEKKVSVSKTAGKSQEAEKDIQTKKVTAGETKKPAVSKKNLETAVDKNEELKPIRKKKVDVVLTLKAKSKIGKKQSKSADGPEDIEADDFPTLDDDLSLGLDDLDSDIAAPIKRRPGRPSKAKDAPVGKLIAFPTSSARLPKREPIKSQRILSSTLPGSSLAHLLSSKVSSIKPIGGRLEGFIDKAPLDTSIPILSNDSSLEVGASDSLPSWTPRNWVTREGERLIIRGQELLREEQFGNLEAETASGVISPDEVEEVIRRIRESYKKKTTSKKVT